jgi:hypothetical protein
MGTATLKEPDGSEHVVTYSSIQQNDQIIAVVEPERLCVKLDRETLRVQPNGELVLDLKLSRGEGLTGAAEIEVVMPAHFKGVTAPRVELPAGANEGKLRIRFARDAGPFNAPLLIRAVVKDRDLPVTAETKLELVPAK